MNIKKSNTPMLAVGGIGLIAMALAGGADAATFCVQPAGAGGCSTTVAAAVALAAPGDTVLVKPGLYKENVTISTAGVILRGVGKAILDGEDGGGNTLIVNANDVHIRNMHFRNGLIRAISIVTGITGTDVQRNNFSGSENSAVGSAGVGNTGTNVSNNTMFGAGGDVISLTGDDVNVIGNRISRCDDDCIDVTGNNATVERNTITGAADGTCIDVSGNNAQVNRNRIFNCDDDGIDVSGDNPVVERNQVSLTGNTGIDVTCNTTPLCDAAHVAFNRVTGTTDDEGIVVSAGSVGTVVERNSATEIGDTGIRVSGAAAVTLQNNRVSAAGEDTGDFCIEISGTGGHIVTGNFVRDCQSHGFSVPSNGNTLRNNVVNTTASNGFDISGNTNTLENNRTTNNGGFGYRAELSAFATTMTNNRATLTVREQACVAERGAGSGAPLGLVAVITGPNITSVVSPAVDVECPIDS